jgi:catalase
MGAAAERWCSCFTSPAPDRPSATSSGWPLISEFGRGRLRLRRRVAYAARLSSARFVDNMEANAGGPHRGFRRVHSKGLCVAGTFQAASDAKTWSKASVFSGAVIPVIGRFAEANPDPFMADGPPVVRSMAPRLRPPGGGEWRTGMNNTLGLQVSTPEAFNDLMIAAKPDAATGEPDPAKMQVFLAAHPETVTYNVRAATKPLAADFVNDTYNSVDGFYYVAPDGTRRLVRWRMEPEAPFTVRYG